jgi:ADP-ribosylglycohydrolase
MEESLARARLSLDGLSVGDALGGFFEFARPGILNQKRLPSPPWHFTDDTNMALSIYAILRQYGQIDQDRLAESFAEHFDRSRGYGMGMVHMLPRVRNGGLWREIAPAMFGEQGSFGNGAAMRVAPIGAYFADDLDAVVEQARLSAVVTHAHPEAMAGAIAAACAAAWAWRLRKADPRPTRAEFINHILPHVPESDIREKMITARDLDKTAFQAAQILGSGFQVTAQDTVPFTIWIAGSYVGQYETAIWETISAGGDVDTTCAIVGGIVVMSTGRIGIPAEWLKRREELPLWAFGDDVS